MIFRHEFPSLSPSSSHSWHIFSSSSLCQKKFYIYSRLQCTSSKSALDINLDSKSRRNSSVSLTFPTVTPRAELPRRVNKTASQYGIRTTTIYTDPDAQSQHALSSPFAVNLGHPSAYLDGDKIIKVAQQQGCMSIHPGYGFVRLFSHAFARLVLSLSS